MGMVVCLGEVMMRLYTPEFQRLGQSTAFELNYGGAEYNVALALGQLGQATRYVSCLPENPMALACMRQMAGFGVDNRFVLRGGERMGIYFMEKGTSMRPSKVIYDRAHSSFAALKAGDIDWKRAFEGADWFHWTGISPALSDGLVELCREACETAHEMGLTVSCDPNFRSNLWSRDKARRVLGGLMEHVDVLIANEGSAIDVFELDADPALKQGGLMTPEGHRQLSHRLSERLGFKKVALTERESLSAEDNNWRASLYDARTDTLSLSRMYKIHIVDRVGGGDAFAAGLIYGMESGWADQKTVDFATAASALKHTVEGDFTLTSRDEILSIMQGDGSGRILR